MRGVDNDDDSTVSKQNFNETSKRMNTTQLSTSDFVINKTQRLLESKNQIEGKRHRYRGENKSTKEVLSRLDVEFDMILDDEEFKEREWEDTERNTGKKRDQSNWEQKSRVRSTNQNESRSYQKRSNLKRKRDLRNNYSRSEIFPSQKSTRTRESRYQIHKSQEHQPRTVFNNELEMENFYDYQIQPEFRYLPTEDWRDLTCFNHAEEGCLATHVCVEKSCRFKYFMCEDCYFSPEHDCREDVEIRLESGLFSILDSKRHYDKEATKSDNFNRSMEEMYNDTHKAVVFLLEKIRKKFKKLVLDERVRQKFKDSFRGLMDHFSGKSSNAKVRIWIILFRYNGGSCLGSTFVGKITINIYS